MWMFFWKQPKKHAKKRSNHFLKVSQVRKVTRKPEEIFRMLELQVFTVFTVSTNANYIQLKSIWLPKWIEQKHGRWHLSIKTLLSGQWMISHTQIYRSLALILADLLSGPLWSALCGTCSWDETSDRNSWLLRSLRSVDWEGTVSIVQSITGTGSQGWCLWTLGRTDNGHVHTDLKDGIRTCRCAFTQ